MALDTKRLIGIAIGGPKGSKTMKKREDEFVSETDDEDLYDPQGDVDDETELDDEDIMDDDEARQELPDDPMLTKERLRCADDAFRAIERGDRRAFVEAILAIADQTEY